MLIAEAVTGLDTETLLRMDRVIHLAGSALALPEAGFEGKEFYVGVAVKAAILGSRLIRNHPLPDGNKRTAWLSMMEFLERNGAAFIERDPTEDIARRLEMLAGGELEEEEFITWFRSCVDPFASLSDDEFKAFEGSLLSEELVCSACRGSGRDLDGSTCIECGGEGRMVRADVGIFIHMLSQRGLGTLSSDEVAATLSLVGAFGFEWRERLSLPQDISAVDVWEEVLRAGAKNSVEAERAVSRWRHGL